MKIHTRLKRIRKKEVELSKQLSALQQECQHPASLVRYGSNTGNWSSSDDCYWADFYCPDCEARWSRTSKEAGYNNPNNYKEVKDFPKGMYEFYRTQQLPS